jgi:hypothetical protein
MENQKIEQHIFKKSWWQLKKISRKDYGRFAIFALILAALKSAVQIQLPILISILSDVLISVGLVAGVIWVIKLFQESKKEL